MPKKILILFLFIISYSTSNAQYGRTYEELGIMAGPVFFQSDFGARGELENAIKNIGFSIGVFYYISLEQDRTSFKENFKIRLEASYMKTQLEHHGKYVESTTSNFARQLRGMRSTVEAGSVGAQLEFYPFKTDDYNRGGIISPYISLGSQISSYTAKAYSLLGPIGTPLTTPIKYIDGFKSNTGVVLSATASMGVRFKVSEYHAIIVDGRLQYYFSDWVDGMNPDRRTYKENKTNDYSATLNIGYVYYFN